MFPVVRRTDVVDVENEIATFLLHDFSGNITGYQRYDWQSHKKYRNDEKGIYYTYRDKNKHAVFGLNYWLNKSKYVFVCEGVMDAITLLHHGDTIAVLSNNPKPLKQQLGLITRPTVAICQGDKAGMKLAKYTDTYITLPDGEDANSLGAKRMFDVLQENKLVEGEYNEIISW